MIYTSRVDVQWHVFISHASEDKDEIARPLANALRSKGLNVWYDEFSIKPGERISESIEKGLKSSAYCIIIVSKSFLQKKWTKHEFDTILYKAVSKNKKTLIPIWHKVSLAEVESFSLSLADTKALKSDIGLEQLSDELYNIVKHSSIETKELEEKPMSQMKDFVNEILRILREGQNISTNDLRKLRYIMLEEVYYKSKGSKLTFIPFDFLYQLLSKDKIATEAVDTCYRYLRNSTLISSRAIGTVSITQQGIKEIEKSILEPTISTSHFPAGTSEMLSEDHRAQIREIIKMKTAFLNEAYRLSNGNDFEILNAFEVIQNLGQSKDSLNSIYWYLEDEGLIKTHALGGKFTITFECIKYFENRNTDPRPSTTAKLVGLNEGLDTVANELINEIDILNNISKIKLGYKLLINDAKTCNDIRNDLVELKDNFRDEKTFLHMLILLGNLIDDVNRDEMKSQVEPPKPGSINLLESLLKSLGVEYNSKAILSLRQIYKLRSTKAAHKGEYEVIKVFEDLKIEYPVMDWAFVAERLLKMFVDSIKEIRKAISRIPSSIPLRSRKPSMTKASLRIDSLEKTRVDSIELRHNTGSTKLVGNVWTIKVNNNSSGVISDCHAELRLFLERRDRGDYLPLMWRAHNELPNRIDIHHTTHNKEHYLNSLVLRYIGRLGGNDYIDLLKDTGNEILFLVTFNESDSIHIISFTASKMLTETDIPSLSIRFTELQRYLFLIKFYSNDYTEPEQNLFRLDATSWDNIILTNL